jgi:hypothetical protein
MGLLWLEGHSDVAATAGGVPAQPFFGGGVHGRHFWQIRVHGRHFLQIRGNVIYHVTPDPA